MQMLFHLPNLLSSHGKQIKIRISLIIDECEFSGTRLSEQVASEVFASGTYRSKASSNK